MKKLQINVKHVLERYNSIRKPCPQCKKMMIPLGDPPMESYLWCFDCKIEQPLEKEGSASASTSESKKEAKKNKITPQSLGSC